MADDRSDALSHYDFGVIGRTTRSQHTKHSFWFAFLLAEVFGIGACVLIGLWTGKYDYHTVSIGSGVCEDQAFDEAVRNLGTCTVPGGFGTYPSFDYHAFLMVIGLVFLVGQGTLVFRVFRGVSKNALKVVHLLIMLVSLGVMGPGIYAIFAITDDGMANPHDWIGLAAVILYVLQFLVGFVAKFFPGASPPIAAWYRPIHNFMGIVIFALTCTTAMMGSAIAGQSDFTAAGTLSKFFVVFALVYAILVIFLLVNEDFKREDEQSPEELRLMGGSYFGRNYRSTLSERQPGVGHQLAAMNGPPKRKRSPSNTSKKSVSFDKREDEEPIVPMHAPIVSEPPPGPSEEPFDERPKSLPHEDVPDTRRSVSPDSAASPTGVQPFPKRDPKRQTWHGKSGVKKRKPKPTLLDWVVGDD